jgi:uncharacterized membrane protein
MDERPDPQGMASVVQRNIRQLAEVRGREEAKRTTSDRVADAITRFAGSMWCVYAHAGLYGGWLVVNAGAVPACGRGTRSRS